MLDACNGCLSWFLLIETRLGLLFIDIGSFYAWPMGKNVLEFGITMIGFVFMILAQVDKGSYEFDWFGLMINYLKVFLITVKHSGTCIRV